MPIGHSDSSVEIFKSDFNKFTYMDLVLYELPYRESFAINDSLISDSVKYEYFIFNTRHQDGYLLKKITDSFGKKKNIDSILIPRAYYHYTFDSILNLKNKHKIKYEGKDKIRINFLSHNENTDSIIANFNVAFKNLQYTLAPKLDSTFQSKLYKVEYWYKTKGKNRIPLVATFEIKRDKIKNTPEIRQLFCRFKQYTSK